MRAKGNGFSLRRFLAGENHTGELSRRLLLRVISWRIGGVILGIAIAWYITGNPMLGLEIGLAYNLIRVVTHWGHEILWGRIKWGLHVPPRT